MAHPRNTLLDSIPTRPHITGYLIGSAKKSTPRHSRVNVEFDKLLEERWPVKRYSMQTRKGDSDHARRSVMQTLTAHALAIPRTFDQSPEVQGPSSTAQLDVIKEEEEERGSSPPSREDGPSKFRECSGQDENSTILLTVVEVVEDAEDELAPSPGSFTGGEVARDIGQGGD